MIEQFLSPTTDRHNHLVSTFFADSFPYLKRKEIYTVQEQVALVHYGEKTRDMGNFIELVDVLNMKQSVEGFINGTINELEWVQPDFMLFKNNKYLKNNIGTRIAGQPDLIVEVWSDSNTKLIRDIKFNLYSSSAITEHWYLEQNSNNVECWLGTTRLQDQTLANILKTQNEMEFDLRYLALEI